jgi:hypothetical protein
MLRKGMVLYTGVPGCVGYFTTRKSLQRVGWDSTALFHGLQVAPYQNSYRAAVAAFLVTKDLPAAMARARANQHFGTGGLTQFYIADFDTCGGLELVLELPLHTVVHAPAA